MFMRGLAFLLLIAITSLVGCNRRSAENYVPGEQQARQALQIALDAWKANQKSDASLSIPDGPNVVVLDIHWREGQKLQNYEILSEVAGGAGEPKKFNVRLTYEGQAPLETTYHVVGINPLRVFRNEDYQNATGMGTGEQ